MPYLARKYLISQSLLYHIFNRGNAKSEIFHDESDYLHFIKILKKYSSERNFGVYHWVLMPNHFHLLAELKKPKQLSSLMAGITRAYVHYYHAKYQSAGHLFQGRFKSQPIEKETYLLSCARYIEKNPIKANLSSIADRYSFSSALFYTQNINDGLTKEDPLYFTFGEEQKERQKNYFEFLKEDYDEEDDAEFNNLEMPIGSKEFKSRMVKDKGIFVPRKGRPRVYS